MATAAVAAGPATAGATFMTYASRTAFNAAEPGLPVQTFSSVNLISSPITTHASPIDATTNDAVLSAGTILPGLTITTLSPGSAANALAFTGYGSNGSKSVGTTWYGDSLVFDFAPGVHAFAADVFAINPPVGPLAGSFEADAFNGSTEIGIVTFAEAAGSFGFVGFSSTTAITSVQLLYTTTDDMTMATNIAFGPSPVPEPASLALAAVGAIVGLGMTRARRRRRRLREL
jgi:hypothetical protein